MGAALAYYTAFSLSPLLLVIIAAAGLIVDEGVTQTAILHQFAGLLGTDGAHFIQTLLQSTQHKESGIISIVVSAITLFIGATSVFAELESDLNRIWRVGKKPINGVSHFLRIRFLSFGLVLAVGFLLVVSLMLSTAINAMATLFGQWHQQTAYLLDGLNFVISFGAITVLFALIYKLLPDVKIALSDVWFGATCTALLFSFGKYFIGLYLGRSAISSSFGAAGTFIVLMVWIYYSAQIFLLGAEFTYVYASNFGSLSGSLNGTIVKRPIAEAMATRKKGGASGKKYPNPADSPSKTK